MLTSLEERKRKYARARYNYYRKAVGSLNASLKYQQKHNLDTAETSVTLEMFTQERDKFFDEWQNWEAKAATD
tara:strand:+ start:250 stop:468 length:219 start_codon:yes stop_codon:yes gene_type:complete